MNDDDASLAPRPAFFAKHEDILGSRRYEGLKKKKLKILISSRHGSWVCHYCEYFERQFENAFFQVESAQT